MDALWLCPVLASPQVDNGYDVSDYRSIDPMFGSMEDMRTLIREARARGIGILMDLVLNHTSDQHRWFQQACQGRDNPYHDYYIWRDGAPGALPTICGRPSAGRPGLTSPPLGNTTSISSRPSSPTTLR